MWQQQFGFQRDTEQQLNENPYARGERGRFRGGRRGYRGRRRNGRRGRGPGRAFVPREYGPVDQVSTLEKAGEVDLRWALQRFCTEQSQRKLQMALDAQERTDRDDLQETAINMRAIRETSGRELLQMETAERYFQGLAQLTTQEICRAYPEYDWRFVAQSKDILDALIEQVDQIGCDAKEILQFADDALESRKLKEVKVEQTGLPGKPERFTVARIIRYTGLVMIPVAVLLGVYFLRK